MNLSYSLDIATSFSIIIAAFYYVQDGRRGRIQRRNEFAISRLQKIVDSIASQRLQFMPIYEDFSKSAGTEKTKHFNRYILLMKNLYINIHIIKDSDFEMYANEKEKKVFNEIIEYIDECNETTSKIINGEVSPEIVQRLENQINTYDKKLSSLSQNFSIILKERLHN